MTPTEVNQLAFARAKLRLPGCRMYDEADALWGFLEGTGKEGVIAGCFFDEGNVRERVDFILRTFQAEAAPASFFYGPSSSPPELAKILRKERRCMGPRYLPAMGLGLGDASLGTDPGLAAELIQDWSLVSPNEHPTALWHPKPHRASYLEQMEGLARSSQTFPFLVSVGGQPAGSCVLFIEGGIAGIYDVATRPEFRGKGVASNAIKTALRFARERGCEVAVLQSHKKAAGLYERLGFRETGMFTSMYYSRIRSEADAKANRLQ